MDIKKIRKDFPIFRRRFNKRPLVYLDNAATTQKPKQVLDAEREFYEKHNANVHRGLNFLSQEATEKYEEAHDKTARFIGARGVSEIVFTKNTTESLNLLAYSLGERISAGDEILITKMEHHANLVPWQQVALRKKAKLVYANITSDGRLDLADLEGKTGARTKIVSVTMASNILGTVNPVKEISGIVRDEAPEAAFIVDAAQAVPHVKADVRKIGCDFMAFSAHKMMGPTGVGVLYGREDVMAGMPPFLTGGDMISTVTLERAEWNKLPWKFEAGTPNIAGGIGFGTAIDYVSRVGIDAVEVHEQKLLRKGIERLEEIKGVEVYGPEKGPRTGIIPFNVNGVHPHDVASVLDQRAVAIRSGNHCAQPLMAEMGVEGVARASFYIYNTEEEIEELALGIEGAKKIFMV